MQYKTLVDKLVKKEDLLPTEMRWLMEQMLKGAMSEAEIAEILMALHNKGESVAELIEAVRVLRKLAKSIQINRRHLIDIVGTGGDGLQTFNISTACCFIVAAAGGAVAKQGNRASSSRSGSADVLEAAGVNLNRTPEKVAATIEHFGVGFLFAPKHHAAMAHVAAARKKLAIRTLFNLLGPLVNPAQAEYHLIGVYDKKWLMPFAEILKNLSTKKALIVHGEDGLDEISLATKTQIVELSNQTIQSYEIFPEQFGIASQSLDNLQIQNAAESLKMILQVFNDTPGAARDIVLLNAGAALYAADLESSIAAGIEKSRELLSSGKVLQLFNEFVKESN